MTEPLLTEGDLARGRGPDLVNQHWLCAVVDPATGAVCTLRPHDEGDEHKGLAAVQGTGRSTKVVSWTGGKERAMVLDAYRWTRLPGSNIEIRALTDRPLAMRYRHRGCGSRLQVTRSGSLTLPLAAHQHRVSVG